MEGSVQQLADLLSGSASHAVAEYTRWYFISAIIWTTFWLIAALGAYKIKWESFVDDDLVWLRYVPVSLCVLFFVTCITNIFAPEAYAIHQLINDIKP